MISRLAKAGVIAALLLTTSLLARDVPAYDSPVVDLAGLLSPKEEQRLERRILGYRDSTQHEIGVLIIPSLEGDDLETFANKVYNKWGIGKSAEDNGALLLIALEDRKIRLEVGYGLEAALTDLESGLIVGTASNMAILFRKQEWAKGIDVALDGIIAAIGGEYVPLDPLDDTYTWYVPWLISMFVFIMIIGTIVLSVGRAIARYKQGKSGVGSKGDFWFGGLGGGSGFGSGSFGGGGFGGFSGGSSGGGGASGGW